MQKQENSPIVCRSKDLALKIIDFVKELRKIREYEIASQLIRSGTSVGANISEAQFASSRNDFRHKMKIAHKEAYETKFWIELCNESKHLPDPNKELISILKEVLKLLYTINLKLKN